MKSITKRINADNIKELICFFLFVFSGVILAALYCLINKKMITDIYLPSGLWNDEAFYYKQIQAMVEYGIPQGYFGYSEQSAQYLTFGAWSFVLLIPYAVFGKLTWGWNLLSPIYCNLFMFTLSLLIFYIWVRPKPKQIIAFVFMLACSPLIIRYIISGMVEPIFLSGGVLMCGMYYKFKSGEYDIWFLFGTYLLIGFLTLARPYCLLGILVPFYFWRKKSPYKATGITILYGLFLVGVYVIVNKWFCAPSFKPTIDFGFLDYFKEGIIYGVYKTLEKYMIGWKDVILYCKWAFLGDRTGEMILPCVVFMLFAATLSVVNSDKYFLRYVSFYEFIIISACIMLHGGALYSGRHGLMVYIQAITAVAMQDIDIKWGKYFGCVIAGLLLVAVPKSEYIYSVPCAENDTVIKGQTIEQELSEILTLEDGIGWNNTVSWVYDEDYGICYYLPAGFGINLVHDGTQYEEFCSEYILTKNYSVTNSLISEKAEKIWEYDDWILYRKE